MGTQEKNGAISPSPTGTASTETAHSVQPLGSHGNTREEWRNFPVTHGYCLHRDGALSPTLGFPWEHKRRMAQFPRHPRVLPPPRRRTQSNPWVPMGTQEKNGAISPSPTGTASTETAHSVQPLGSH